jgi:hypothetical protein
MTHRAVLLLLFAGANVAHAWTDARELHYADKMPACDGILHSLPAKAEKWSRGRDPATPCKATINSKAPPTTCPSAVCKAYAAALGPVCFEESHILIKPYADAAAALTGGPAMPADEVKKLQAVLDALEKIEPIEYPRVELAAALKSGDAELAATFEAEATFLKAFVAACAPHSYDRVPPPPPRRPSPRQRRAAPSPRLWPSLRQRRAAPSPRPRPRSCRCFSPSPCERAMVLSSTLATTPTLPSILPPARPYPLRIPTPRRPTAPAIAPCPPSALPEPGLNLNLSPKTMTQPLSSTDSALRCSAKRHLEPRAAAVF